MKSLALHKVAILAVALAVGSLSIIGVALAKTSAHATTHPHQAGQSSQATKKDDCAAWSWEIPIATSGMPETTMPCPRNGANPKG
jgi:Cu/Ag efflux protein CusF